LAVHPSAVDGGSIHTIDYTFTAGPGGLSKGGGLRIEIPLAYAETEFLFWSKPQTEDKEYLGYTQWS
jgi:hypothetical protein